MSRTWVMVVLMSVGGLWLTGCESESPGEKPAGCQEDNCGVCDDDPANDCTEDCNGDWGGTAIMDCEGTCGGSADCSECEAGHFGADCTECPGGAAVPCSGHGSCDEGKAGDGTCACDLDWGSDDCSIEGARNIGQVSLEENPFSSLYPQVSTGAGGHAYLVWQQCRLGDPCEKITVMVSRYEGGWGPAVEVSPLSEGSANAEKPDVVVDSSGVAHIVWRDSGSVGSLVRSSDSNIIYRTWDGTTLGATSVVSVGGPMECSDSDDCLTLFDAEITLAGDSPRVVFDGAGVDRKREVYYATHADDGWSVTQLSDSSLDPADTEMNGGSESAIANDLQGNIHVIWKNERADADRTSSIHHVAIGESVGAIAEIATACSPSRIYSPNIALGALGEVHAVWVGNRDCADSAAGYGVFYSAAGAAAVDLTTDAPLSAADNLGPVVVATPLGVAVTWVSTADVSSSGSDYDVVSQWFGADGTPVPGLEVLSEALPNMCTSTTSSLYPSMAVGATALHTCWQEKEVGESGDNDIHCTSESL